MTPEGQAAVLGALQGVTEFLPVSSSGHLVLAQRLFGLEGPEVLFDLILHLGTLCAVLAFYRTEAWGILSEAKILFQPERIRLSFRTRPLFRLGALIVIGSIPTAIIGLLFEDFFTSLFSSLTSAGVCLLLSAAFLTAAAFREKTTIKSELEFPVSAALLIGLVQGLAIAPGLSRSGATISLAIMLGMERSLAGRFSFLLSVPAICGAILLSISGAGPSAFPKSAALLGFAVAAATGFLSLFLLSGILKKDRFHIFAPWCFAAALTALWLARRT